MSAKINCTKEHNHWPIYIGVKDTKTLCSGDIGKIFIRTAPPSQDMSDRSFIPEGLDDVSIKKAAVRLTLNGLEKSGVLVPFSEKWNDNKWMECNTVMHSIHRENMICFNAPFPNLTPAGFDSSTQYCTYSCKGETLDDKQGQLVVRLNTTNPDRSFIPQEPTLHDVLHTAIRIKHIYADGTISFKMNLLGKKGTLYPKQNTPCWIRVDQFFDHVKPEDVQVHDFPWAAEKRLGVVHDDDIYA